MSSGIVIALKARPYIKEFIIHRYGKEPIFASKNNLIGLILEILIEKPPKENLYEKIDNPLLIELPPVFNRHTNYLGKDKVTSSFNYLSRANNRIFEKYFAELFYNSLYVYLDQAILLHENVRDLRSIFQYDEIRKELNKLAVFFKVSPDANVAFQIFIQKYIGMQKFKIDEFLIKNSIIRFCEEYGVKQESANYEMLKKSYYRYRNMQYLVSNHRP